MSVRQRLAKGSGRFESFFSISSRFSGLDGDPAGVASKRDRLPSEFGTDDIGSLASVLSVVASSLFPVLLLSGTRGATLSFSSAREVLDVRVIASLGVGWAVRRRDEAFADEAESRMAFGDFNLPSLEALDAVGASGISTLSLMATMERSDLSAAERAAVLGFAVSVNDRLSAFGSVARLVVWRKTRFDGLVDEALMTQVQLSLSAEPTAHDRLAATSALAELPASRRWLSGFSSAVFF